MRHVCLLGLFCLLVGLPLSAEADLIDRGSGLIYDTDLNVTWMQDTNYTKTSNGSDTTGRMSWNDATAWAFSLVYGGFDDWRLPTWAGRNDEFAHLYYVELGNEFGGGLPPKLHFHSGGAGGPVVSFINMSVQSYQSVAYWTSTQRSSSTAQDFNFYGGGGGESSKGSPWFAWAVRDGDVAAAQVPEPGTGAMMSLGLGMLGFVARRRKMEV